MRSDSWHPHLINLVMDWSSCYGSSAIVISLYIFLSFTRAHALTHLFPSPPWFLLFRNLSQCCPSPTRGQATLQFSRPECSSPLPVLTFAWFWHMSVTERRPSPHRCWSWWQGWAEPLGCWGRCCWEGLGCWWLLW